MRRSFQTALPMRLGFARIIAVGTHACAIHEMLSDQGFEYQPL